MYIVQKKKERETYSHSNFSVLRAGTISLKKFGVGHIHSASGKRTTLRYTKLSLVTKGLEFANPKVLAMP